MRLEDFIARCAGYFASSGCMIDQPFQPRLAEGMIRCYLAHDEVVGFAHQLIRGLMPTPSADAGPEASLPGPRVMYGAAEPGFEPLRLKMESE